MIRCLTGLILLICINIIFCQYEFEILDVDPNRYDIYAQSDVACDRFTTVKISSVVNTIKSVLLTGNGFTTSIYLSDDSSIWIGELHISANVNTTFTYYVTVIDENNDPHNIDTNYSYYCESQPGPLKDLNSNQALIESKPGYYGKIVRFSDNITKLVSFPVMEITPGYIFTFSQVSITEFYFECSIDLEYFYNSTTPASTLSPIINFKLVDPKNKELILTFPSFIKNDSRVPTIHSLFYIDLSIDVPYKVVSYRLFVENYEGSPIYPIGGTWEFIKGNPSKYEILQKRKFSENETLYSTSTLYFKNYVPYLAENRSVSVDGIQPSNIEADKIFLGKIGDDVYNYDISYLNSYYFQYMDIKFNDISNPILLVPIKNKLIRTPLLIACTSSFKGNVTIGQSSIAISGSGVPDEQLPNIHSVTLDFISRGVYMFTFNATDNVMVYKIIINFFNGDRIFLSQLDKDINTGLFITQYSNILNVEISSIFISDTAGNSRTYDKGFTETVQIPLFKDNNKKVSKNQIKVKSMRFELYDIDISKIGFNNRLYLTTDSNRTDLKISLRLTGIKNRIRFPTNVELNWVPNLNCYVSLEFYVPAKIFTGAIIYEIWISHLIYTNFELAALLGPSAQLRVKSTVNILPPQISNLEIFQNVTHFGYYITVQSDSQYYSATLNIRGDLDTQQYTLFINSSISSNLVVLEKSSLPQRSQKFSIIGVSTNSDYIIGFWGLDPINNHPCPILNLLSQGIQAFDINVNFPPPPDLTPPIVNDIIRSVGTVDTSEISSLFFLFYLRDTSGILLSKVPKCKLTSIYGTQQSVDAFAISPNTSNTEIRYNCSFSIERGFSLPLNASYLSITDYSDIYLNSGSMSTYDISLLTSDYIVSFTYTPKPYYTSYISTLNKDIVKATVFGKNFAFNPDKFKIRYWYEDNISKYMSISSLIGSVMITCEIPSSYTSVTYFSVIHDGVESFTMVALINTAISPTLPPFKCPGTPECGGPSNGKCLTTGCECISPWYGTDCLSQTIITKPPTVNNTNPDFETDLDGVGGQKPVTLKSLISIVSIDELSVNDTVLVSHSFNEWKYTNTTSDSQIQEYTYESAITNSGLKTNIKITVQWFLSNASFYFANEKIDMKPSTLKYKIEISEYKFQSPLNKLQLVMGASIQGNQESKDSCTYQEFDNSNPVNDYMKLQIDSHSLYGRFIKRGIIDNRIQQLSNRIISSDSSSSTQSNSLIGLLIPNYSYSAIIDPDFSLLVETKPADENSNSICSNKSKGLTKAQLAGIIIGSTVFGLAIILSIVYYRYHKGTLLKLYITKLKVFKK